MHATLADRVRIPDESARPGRARLAVDAGSLSGGGGAARLPRRARRHARPVPRLRRRRPRRLAKRALQRARNREAGSSCFSPTARPDLAPRRRNDALGTGARARGQAPVPAAGRSRPVLALDRRRAADGCARLLSSDRSRRKGRGVPRLVAARRHVLSGARRALRQREWSPPRRAPLSIRFYFPFFFGFGFGFGAFGGLSAFGFFASSTEDRSCTAASRVPSGLSLYLCSSVAMIDVVSCWTLSTTK